jgi:hypothetical protein
LIILPRQARDRKQEISFKTTVFSQAAFTPGSLGVFATRARMLPGLMVVVVVVVVVAVPLLLPPPPPPPPPMRERRSMVTGGSAVGCWWRWCGKRVRSLLRHECCVRNYHSPRQALDTREREACQAKKAFPQAIPVELEPPPVLEAVPVVNVQDPGAFDVLKTRTKKNDNGNGIIDYVTTVLKPLMVLPLLYTLIVLLCSLEFDRADMYRRKL